MKQARTERLTRRRLVQWLAAIGGRVLSVRLIGFAGSGLAVSSCAEDEAASPAHPTSELHHAIREHFTYLSIDDAVVNAFEKDLTRHHGAWSASKSPRPFTRFLASTDFFQNGGDESRPLTYVSYYDPYVSTCYNPFADTSAPRERQAT